MISGYKHLRSRESGADSSNGLLFGETAMRFVFSETNVLYSPACTTVNKWNFPAQTLNTACSEISTTEYYLLHC
jgi:hypothetical protein